MTVGRPLWLLETPPVVSSFKETSMGNDEGFCQVAGVVLKLDQPPCCRHPLTGGIAGPW